jgi:hypothetical protein
LAQNDGEGEEEEGESHGRSVSAGVRGITGSGMTGGKDLLVDKLTDTVPRMLPVW